MNMRNVSSSVAIWSKCSCKLSLHFFILIQRENYMVGVKIMNMDQSNVTVGGTNHHNM